MLSRRNWILRLSIILNVVVLCYVGTHFTNFNNGVELIDVQAAGGGNTAALMEYGSYQQNQDAKNFLIQKKNELELTEKLQGNLAQSVKETLNNYPSVVVSPSNKTNEVQNSGKEENTAVDSVVMVIPGKFREDRSGDNTKSSEGDFNSSTVFSESRTSPGSAFPESSKLSLEEIIKCHNKDQVYRTVQKGDFWVLYNYIKATRTFKCYEVVTYTTHSDFTFLDNLEPLLERWQGPISVAMHAPGTDYNSTLKSIQYLRKCGSSLVSELVTFHIYFGTKYVPKKILKPAEVEDLQINCDLPPPWVNVTSKQLFKTQKKILYPVNVGRNIAREAAVTHYVLASDIELYPNPGLIIDFMELIKRQDPPLLRKKPKVFAIPIFEVESDAAVPQNKTQLVKMLKSGKAIPFHKRVCPGCHNVPKSKEWILTNETKGLHVFTVGKRLGYFVHWEPIYIGTHQEPLYEERLSWEGMSDKMTQGYVLCVLDYEFLVLDNAFLVHKPGIKTKKKDNARAILAAKTNSLIRRVILPELKLLYGTRHGCAV